MKLSVRLFAIVLFSLFITGCQNDQLNEEEVNSDQDENLMIYTTIYPFEFLANEIGGEFVEAESILPAGSDAHSFEPTSRAMVEIAEADLFIYNDGVSESYAMSIKDALEGEAVAFLEASEGLDRISYHDDHDQDHDDHDDDDHHDHDHGDYDPHVWLSPRLMQDLAENILTKLIELAPEQEAAFQENYDLVAERLTELDQYFSVAINEANRNEMLVTHAAYGYWAHDYGVEQIAITGLSATEEPSQRQLANLIESVSEMEIEYILFEQNIQPRVASVIQDEVGLTDLQIHNLAVLTEEDVDNGHDYFVLMERNIDVLKEALH